ncbi:BPI fold-containing family B member 3-like [Emydura macquarii macquarii]|uniref:BPI fold-containing family B member 3-like n=1 Tax=Emydura macquarii macquarii TaxID=1129001 RepID=UPI00352BA698
MLKVWAVLLFCGLLAPSQGLDVGATVINSVTANGLEKTIGDLLSGGDILQSVLGAVSGGNGGLLNLGNLLGPGLLGLEIKNLTLPKVSLKLLPGVGVQLNVNTKVSVDGKGLLGRVLRLQAEENIAARARLLQDNVGVPKLTVEDCKIQLLNIRIPLKWLCPLIDTVLNTVNTQLGTVNSVVPLGVLGNLQYTLSSLPVVSDGSIKLDLNAVVKDPLGNIISDPTCSAAPISLPLVGSSSQLALPACLLTSVLKLLLVPEKLNTDITGQMLPANILQVTSALRSIIPQVSDLLPASQQPLLKIKVLDTPVVSLQNGAVTARLPASIDVSLSDSPQKSLFVLDADTVLNAQPTIADNKLRLSSTLESVNLSLASSQIGPVNVTGLEPLMSNLLGAAYVPPINAALDVGIPLPNPLNLNLENSLVKTIDNTLVINALG